MSGGGTTPPIPTLPPFAFSCVPFVRVCVGGRKLFNNALAIGDCLSELNRWRGQILLCVSDHLKTDKRVVNLIEMFRAIKGTRKTTDGK